MATTAGAAVAAWHDKEASVHDNDLKPIVVVFLKSSVITALIHVETLLSDKNTAAPNVPSG